MADIIRDEDFRVDIGRAEGGRTFVRVVHEPTQVSKSVVGLKKHSHREVERELLAEVIQKLEAAGWRKP